MRRAIKPLPRFLATPMVSKFRLFVWLPTIRIPENAAIVIARADDTTFGILHSRVHELWSLRLGTSLEDRPRYTPTTCIETFPFPAGLTPADTAHQRTEVLDGGAGAGFDDPNHWNRQGGLQCLQRVRGGRITGDHEALHPLIDEPFPDLQRIASHGFRTLGTVGDSCRIAEVEERLLRQTPHEGVGDGKTA